MSAKFVQRLAVQAAHELAARPLRDGTVELTLQGSSLLLPFGKKWDTQTTPIVLSAEDFQTLTAVSR